MRKKRQKQLPLMHTMIDHPHARELQHISAILDSHPTIDQLALQDLTADVMFTNCGAHGMSAEQVVRSALIKQINQYSYEQLAFHLVDSRCYRSFCKIGIADKAFGSSTLGIEQPDFVNAVAGLLTTLSARELLAALLDIEKRNGRERGATRWGPRVLDLDLLVYGAEILDEAGITVPHPGIAERNFVLLPLAEIAPQLVIPALGRVAGIAVNKDEPSISRIL